MTMSPDPYRERASAYIVQDFSNQEEQQRLHLQDRLISTALGGLLPEQPEPTRFSHVLDVACGTGGWLIELAKAYPTLSRLIGVDISKHMVNRASAVAEEQHVQDRVSFRVMDALYLVDLPDNSFDLANLRLAVSFLRSWEWPQALQELRRVTRRGGVIRVTETDLPDQSTSPALQRLFHLLALAYRQAGRYFQDQAHGVSDELAGLLAQQSLQNIQTQIYRHKIRAGTENGQLFFEDMKHLFRTNVPFLHKWIKVPDDYEGLYQQMLYEMQQPDFAVTGQTITAWGVKAL
ncbi:MAG TPA: class I SAM-dependent methyltransferase [Ktedonobacteraceae bacterium]